MKNLKKIDIIIILGCGVDKGGKISRITQERLDFFIKNKEKFFNIPILLSGKCSGLKKDKPKITEVQVMKKYLMTKGIKSRNIYLEMKSLDTISNAIFSKKIIEKHKNWKNIILITSDWHMNRSLWIFKRVFGNSYSINSFSSVSDKKDKKYKKSSEDLLLIIAKKILNKIQSSNKKMDKIFQKIHPIYSKDKIAKDIAKEIVKKKKSHSLKINKEYQKNLIEKVIKLINKFGVTPAEKKKYVLSTDQDYEILDKIKQLEKQKLSIKDKELVKFIRTQLEEDWRTPIIKLLDSMLKKYN